ncbi:hypothetical protein NVP1038O_07 [Vibrio phage 1.038.O._10N.286.51.C2]|nr:hypothetical protein NVP1038O_07 [Vibrio phage 1.038.O._10N.286.51.C2]
MSELDRLIERIEGSGEAFRFCAEQVNPLLVELGGKPICKNISHPGANDGSSLVEIEVYITLLAIRNLADKNAN